MCSVSTVDSCHLYSLFSQSLLLILSLHRFGILSGVPAMCFRGRFHSYEGHDMKTVVLPVHVMRCLNVQVCIVTNAAGALNPDYHVGDVVCISDHLALPQLAGKNPLIGPNDDELGPRFPATSNAYPDELRHAAQAAATKLKMDDFVIPHGVYCFVSGPMYESKAECRFLRSLGGDAVGMSTIPEVIASHHCQMKTLVLSLMTNKVIMTGDEGAPVATHAEVLQAVHERSQQMQALVMEIVAQVRDHVLEQLEPLPSVTLTVNRTAQREYALYRQASLQMETNRQRGGDNGQDVWKPWWWWASGAVMAVAAGVAWHMRSSGKR